MRRASDQLGNSVKDTETAVKLLLDLRRSNLLNSGKDEYRDISTSSLGVRWERERERKRKENRREEKRREKEGERREKERKREEGKGREIKSLQNFWMNRENFFYRK
jgi:hypothetical protein